MKSFPSCHDRCIRQPRILVTLQAPCYIFRKMKMQDIKFIASHDVYLLFNHLQWLEITANIDQKSSPRKGGLVFYRDILYASPIELKLPQGLHSIKNTFSGRRVYRYTLLIDIQYVPFLSHTQSFVYLQGNSR